MASWIKDELRTLDLGDKRRERRVALILEQQSEIAESTPSACKDNAKLEATYRLVNNRNIPVDGILKAHNDASIARTAEQPVVILSQDTTVCDLTKPQRQVRGAGPLESRDKFGFFLHPLYAITEDGLVLGTVDQCIWTRDDIKTDLNKTEKVNLRRQQAFEEKESYRWLEMFQSGEQIALAHPQTHYIGVSDSESDIYELLAQTDDLAANYDYVIRGCQDRTVLDQGETRTISEVMQETEFQFQREIDLSERKSLIIGETRARRMSRSARVASISIRARQVTLRGPARPGGRAPDVTINVVEAVETDAPEGEEPIRWLLFTSLPISTISEIERVIGSYCRRWDIELYFKTLKSGMKIEKLKYEQIDTYVRAVTLLMITGFRVEQLKTANRVCPQVSCERFYDASFWKATYLVVFAGREVPETPPTIGEWMLVVAKLGGYLDKKGQGPPGSTTIWRGMRKIESYHEAFLAYKRLIGDV
ncbi:IS4 family transposase [Stieleria varia]|uniref:Transposase for transposon Tn5 n=1 Tax=Stieleria varia TaxID=2528005 RepID=A0A5C5ZH02_9BACT|nr:IS4 family transposase [Stieleria varia]TWT86395.1 Transposase for transposon Tn5 [Stieleria varia]